MYVTKEQFVDIIGMCSCGLLPELEEKTEFLSHLLEEDDWSFVIKLHALIEAATTLAIVKHVNEPSIRSTIERLPLSDEQIGKLKIAKDLSIYSRPQRSFIKRLSALRNDLVHNIERINFNFLEHLGAMDKNQLSSWIDAVVWFEEQETRSASPWIEIAKTKPQLAVFMAGYLLVVLTSVDSHEKTLHRAIDSASQETVLNLFRGTKDEAP